MESFKSSILWMIYLLRASNSWFSLFFYFSILFLKLFRFLSSYFKSSANSGGKSSIYSSDCQRCSDLIEDD